MEVLCISFCESVISVNIQPRTQAQITKNRHTTVLLYRSVAKLSERAGVLGEDAAKEARRLAHPLRPPQAPRRARSA